MSGTAVEPPSAEPLDATPEVASSLVFADISESQLTELFALESLEDQIQMTATILDVRHYDENPRSAILVDFCYFSLLFCRESSFTLPQTSAFFSIMLKVFTGAVDDRMSSDDCLAMFKKLIMSHSINDTDKVELFTLPDVKKMTTYVANTFFRYITAYQYVFEAEQEVVVEERTIDIETPLSPGALADAESVSELVVTEPAEERVEVLEFS